MKLPKPKIDGEVALEKVISVRRTVRAFSAKGLNMGHLSQLLWAAYGVTDQAGHKRAVASGGALYPLDLYAVLGEGAIGELRSGIYRYEPETHSITLLREGDSRRAIARASLGQLWMAEAPLSIVITAEYKRITTKYGRRGIRYAMIEAGHMGQNLFLQAEALGLGAGIVGAFSDNGIVMAMRIPQSHEPLLIMPVGYRK